MKNTNILIVFLGLFCTQGVFGQLTANITIHNHVRCNGGTDGYVFVVPSNGVSPYTYLWSNGSTVQYNAGISAGVYTVTVTDNSAATISSSVTITEPSALSLSIAVTSNYNGEDISCNGVCDGAMTMSVLGGTPPYNYYWANIGQTTQTATGVCAGLYTGTAIDDAGCRIYDTIHILDPSNLAINLSAITNVSSIGAADGTATISPIGGVGGYNILWNTSPSQTTSTATGLASGTYWPTVTDANGCQLDSSVMIVDPGLNVSILPLSNFNGMAISCFGQNDGVLAANIIGGQSPYTYNWSTGATTTSISGLNAGVYSVTVSDALANTMTASYILKEPSAIYITSRSLPESCWGQDGNAYALGAGGTGNTYTYLWSTPQTGPHISGLSSGLYFVTATDLNGCTATTSETVLSNCTSCSFTSNVIPLVSNLNCNDDNNGMAAVTVQGTGNYYYYYWKNITNNPNNTYHVGPVNSNMTVGVYQVFVADRTCVDTMYTTISAPPPLTVTATITSNYNGAQVSCNGSADGAATVNVSGGTSPYNYFWNPSAVTTQTATGLSAGMWTVTTTDVNGCSTADTVVVLNPPALFGMLIINNHVSCFGGSNGSATLTVVGGTPPYLYRLNGGAWTSFAPVLNNLTAGNHTLDIQDANACIYNGPFTILQPSQLNTTIISQNNVSCNGGADGSITTSSTGGTAPYAWDWGSGYTLNPTVTGSSAGVYCVTVQDANGCTATNCATITEPSAISVSTASTPETCAGNDGTATATASGGTGALSYLWSNLATTSSINGLVQGNYMLTVSDADGCTVTITETVLGPVLSTTNTNYLVAPDSTLSFCVQPVAATSITILQNSTYGSLTANGTGCYTYTPSALPEVSDTIIVEACDGLQTIQNTIIIGIAGCVWAGDTDTNQVVNNFDLLPIGLNYGMVGLPRPNADLNWDCEPMWNWNALPSGQPDPKHSDSNGDGIVNSDDTLAITQNWGQLYLRDGGGDNPHGTGVPLYIDTATTSPGDTILLPIVLGAAAFSATNAYGIAFTVTYDNSIVDTNSIHLLYNNSWLGIDNVDMISVEKDFYFQGKTEIGMTRIDHTTRSGSGPIAHIQLTIKDDVLKQLNRRLDFNISNVRFIDSVGNEMPVVSEASSVLILTTGLERIEKMEVVNFEIFPNPSSGQFSIALSDAQGMVEVSIYNALGQLVKQEQHSAQSRASGPIAVDFEVAPGIYFVQVRNEKGELGVKKLTVR